MTDTSSLGAGARDIVLTGEQQAAAYADAPALVITAPAGTGKTEVLVRRAEQFVNDPASGYKRVLVVTYTTRAAAEFTSRLQGSLGTAMGRVQAETVHGFAQSILTIHGSHVGLPPDFQVITRDEDRAELHAVYDPSWQPDDALGLFRELDVARAKGTAHTHLLAWSEALAYRGAVDFNEMITKATQVLQINAIAQMMRNVYGLVLVDEAQNLTRQQYEFIVALIGQRPESHSPQVPTTPLGDPNQLVTGFAGGDSEHMKDFRSTFGATVRTLSKNFRSSRLLSRLEQVVSQELGRNGHYRGVGTEEASTGILELCQFESERAEGGHIAKWVDGLLADGLPSEAVMPQESRQILPEEIAVLARHAASLDSVSEALADRGREIARAHSVDDYTSSQLGRIAVLLMRSRVTVTATQPKANCGGTSESICRLSSRLTRPLPWQRFRRGAPRPSRVSCSRCSAQSNRRWSSWRLWTIVAWRRARIARRSPIGRLTGHFSEELGLSSPTSRPSASALGHALPCT